MGGKRTYLGSDLAPAEFYRRHADRYANPHAAGVAALLDRVAHRLAGRVLDVGCGDGLVTKLLAARRDPRITGFVGADDAPGMIARYVAETGWPGMVASFSSPLPQADCAVASYALHLCPPSEVARAWFRLWECGCTRVVILGPFKNNPPSPIGFFEPDEPDEAVSGPFGPDAKTLYARVFRRVLPSGNTPGLRALSAAAIGPPRRVGRLLLDLDERWVAPHVDDEPPRDRARRRRPGDTPRSTQRDQIAQLRRSELAAVHDERHDEPTPLTPPRAPPRRSPRDDAPLRAARADQPHVVGRRRLRARRHACTSAARSPRVARHRHARARDACRGAA